MKQKQEYELLRLCLILMGDDVITGSNDFTDGNSSEGDSTAPELPFDPNN